MIRPVRKAHQAGDGHDQKSLIQDQVFIGGATCTKRESSLRPSS